MSASAIIRVDRRCRPRRYVERDVDAAARASRVPGRRRRGARSRRSRRGRRAAVRDRPRRSPLVEACREVRAERITGRARAASRIARTRARLRFVMSSRSSTARRRRHRMSGEPVAARGVVEVGARCRCGWLGGARVERQAIRSTSQQARMAATMAGAGAVLNRFRARRRSQSARRGVASARTARVMWLGPRTRRRRRSPRAGDARRARARGTRGACG